MIKGCSNPAQEFYATKLALALALPTPRVHLVSWPSPEWHQLQDAVVQITKANTTTTFKARKMLDRPHLLVYQMVVGTALHECAGDAAHSGRFRRSLRENGGESLRQLGALLAFDVLLNNWDRVPLVWDNMGNLNNLMLGRPAEATVVSVHGIDQSAVGIANAKEAANYIERVRALCVAVRGAAARRSEGQQEHCSSFAVAACSALSCVEHLGFDEPGTALLLDAGLNDGLARLATIGGDCDPLIYFEQLWDQCRSLCAVHDWGDVWRSNLQLVSPKLMHNIVCAVRESYPPSTWPQLTQRHFCCRRPCNPLARRRMTILTRMIWFHLSKGS